VAIDQIYIQKLKVAACHPKRELYLSFVEKLGNKSLLKKQSNKRCFPHLIQFVASPDHYDSCICLVLNSNSKQKSQFTSFSNIPSAEYIHMTVEGLLVHLLYA